MLLKYPEIVHNYRSGDKREKIIAQPLLSEVKNFERLSKIIMSPPKAYTENIVI